MDAQAKHTNSKREPLHRIIREDVPILAKSLEACGSEAFCALSVVETMLDWWEKNDAYQCTILAPEGGENIGVCVVIMEQYQRKRLLMYAPECETTRFLKCLEETNLIAWDSVSVVARLLKRLSDPVDKILEAKGYKRKSDFYKLYIMMMSPHDALALEDPRLPDNISLRALTEDDTPTLSKNWAFVSVDAESMTRDSIKYNGGVGAVDKDGNLLGWTRWNRWGAIGQLFVFPSYRRLGLGRILTIRMSKEIAKRGRVVAADVLCTNEASLNLFKSIGFHCQDMGFYREVLSVVVTMLDWWEKNDTFRCTILAPEGGEDQGVCVVIMEEYNVKRLLLYAPEGETTRFLKCLEESTLISWDSVSTVGRVLKRLIDPLKKILKAKGYKLYDGSWNHLMTMSPEDALVLEEPMLPNNVSIRALTEGDASFIVHNWKYAEIDGISLTRDGIKYNGGVGAVDKDGNLVGWITWNLWGMLGHLFVFPSHRRLGLAAILTIRMSKEIAKKGRIVTAEVVSDNNASLSLFESLGFHCDHINRSRAMGRDK